MKFNWVHLLKWNIIFILTFSSVGWGQLPPDFAKFTITKGLNPISLVESPDGRIFIVEKDGKILIVENDKVLPEPFFTLKVSDRGERGLLGIASGVFVKWILLFILQCTRAVGK